MKLLTLLFLSLFVLSFVAAVPKIEPYVNDFVNVLTPEQEMNLNLLCDAIEKNTTYEIAIVTVQDTEGQDRIMYANKIGDENGVGKKDKDNGLVILWSMENEKGGAIATGRFSESILNDAKVGRIGREARPLFDNGSYYEGFNYIVSQVQSEIQAVNESINTSTNQSSDGDSSFMWVFIFSILIIGIVFIIISASSESDDDSSSSSSTYSTYSHSSSSSSSGGFSGGSFSGGSFGGGGARF